MEKSTNLFVAVLFSFAVLSCGQSSRDKLHEEVVEQERAENDAPIGLNPDVQERDIQIVAENMAYRPNEIRVQPGESLAIQLSNQGDTEHNIEFEFPAGEEELDENVLPGNTAELRFYAPDEKGTYTFYCPVEDHREKGMTGTMVVE